MKAFRVLAIFTLFLVPYCTAFASLDQSDGLSIVDSFGSTTPLANINEGTTPFAYLAFNTGDINTGAPLFINWVWRNSANAIVSSQFEQVSNFSSNPLQFWNSISNWENVKEAGQWTVDATWTNLANGAKGGFGASQATFTTSPEPISSILFAVGAAPLGITLFKRRKRNSPSA